MRRTGEFPNVLHRHQEMNSGNMGETLKSSIKNSNMTLRLGWEWAPRTSSSCEWCGGPLEDLQSISTAFIGNRLAPYPWDLSGLRHRRSPFLERGTSEKVVPNSESRQAQTLIGSPRPGSCLCFHWDLPPQSSPRPSAWGREEPLGADRWPVRLRLLTALHSHVPPLAPVTRTGHRAAQMSLARGSPAGAAIASKPHESRGNKAGLDSVRSQGGSSLPTGLPCGPRPQQERFLAWRIAGIWEEELPLPLEENH